MAILQKINLKAENIELKKKCLVTSFQYLIVVLTIKIKQQTVININITSIINFSLPHRLIIKLKV